jgi:hypothetical protein
MLYDGRGYLRQAHLTFTGSPEEIKITPAYSSEGLLMSRTEERHWSGDTPGPGGEILRSQWNSGRKASGRRLCPSGQTGANYAQATC